MLSHESIWLQEVRMALNRLQTEVTDSFELLYDRLLAAFLDGRLLAAAITARLRFLCAQRFL